jgi:hypothetical protein
LLLSPNRFSPSFFQKLVSLSSFFQKLMFLSPKGTDTLIMTADMSVVQEGPQMATPTIEFKTWSGNWTWPQTLEADQREKAERQAFDLEFGWMKEADHCLLGHEPHPVTWERFVSEGERDGEICFKAIEQRKPPEDQGKSLEDTYMGSALVIWNRASATALRCVGLASMPMDVFGKLLNRMFDGIPRGSEDVCGHHRSGLGQDRLLPVGELETVDGHVEDAGVSNDRTRIRRRWG